MANNTPFGLPAHRHTVSHARSWRVTDAPDCAIIA